MKNLFFSLVLGFALIPSSHGQALIKNSGTTNVIPRWNFKTVAGVGGANTNFTLSATNHEIVYLDSGTTNVHLVAIMNGSEVLASRITIILTNRTGTDRNLSLGSVTNNWISVQEYDGITAPFVITNGQGGRFDCEVKGTNVQYSFKPIRLPSN